MGNGRGCFSSNSSETTWALVATMFCCSRKPAPWPTFPFTSATDGRQSRTSSSSGRCSGILRSGLALPFALLRAVSRKGVGVPRSRLHRQRCGLLDMTQTPPAATRPSSRCRPITSFAFTSSPGFGENARCGNSRHANRKRGINGSVAQFTAFLDRFVGLID